MYELDNPIVYKKAGKIKVKNTKIMLKEQMSQTFKLHR